MTDLRALFDSAFAAHRAGNLAVAASGYAKVLEAKPDQPDALHLLGLVRLSQGAPEDAERLIRLSLEHSAHVAEIWNSLGNALAAQKKNADAATAFRKALAINPDLAGAIVNLGRVMNVEGNTAEAETLWRQALARDPRMADAWANLGGLCYRANRWAEAVEAFERAADLLPHSPFAANNLGMAYRVVGRLEDARVWQERAVALDPAFEEARLALGVVHLSLGHWRLGWSGHQARRKPARAAELVRTPLPKDLSGRSFLVRRNQGLGDELFFLRFLPELRGRGAGRIVYESDPRLAAMLKRAAIADDIRSEPAQAKPDEIAVSVDDLPFLLGIDDGDPPPRSIRLIPDPERIGAMRERLRGAGPPPYLGLTWRAGTEGWMGISRKEVPVAALGAAARSWPGTVLALQRLPEAGEISALARSRERPVADFSDANDSLEDMLAIVSDIEAYAAVSNTNVHLRAAVGRPTHVLVPSPPDWRWMASGDRSPWFPDCPLFRQRTDASWDEALAALGASLLDCARTEVEERRQ